MDKSYGSVVFRIKSDIEFLLVHHAGYNHWDIPKGHPENSELPQETAIREVLEETNYHINLLPGFEEKISYILPEGDDKSVTFFIGKAVSDGNVKINCKEIQAVKWFSYEEAYEKITFNNSKQVLKLANDFLLNHS